MQITVLNAFIGNVDEFNLVDDVIKGNPRHYEVHNIVNQAVIWQSVHKNLRRRRLWVEVYNSNTVQEGGFLDVANLYEDTVLQ